MKVDRLKRIIRKIEDEPKRLDMGTWGRMVPKKFAEKHQEEFPACGTVGCIAGWTLYLYDPEIKTKMKTALKHWEPEGGYVDLHDLVEYFTVTDRARRLLDISANQATSLFQTECWPDEYREMYDQAKTKKQKAKVTVARIKHMIKTQN